MSAAASGVGVARQRVGAALERITSSAHLNCFVCVDREGAWARVAELERAGGACGALFGQPVAVKDNFCAANGLPTTAGSRMLEAFVSPYDATVVRRLAAAGAVLVGKTNMDEFGMGSFNANSRAGAARLPRDPSRSPGGSSGGSAAAVAAELCFAAVGSDTGGSVRLPAAYCSVVGFKPSYGVVSRHGLVAYASSFDTPGVLARTVRDAALVFESLAGADPAHDATSRELPADDGRALRRVGVPVECNFEELPARTRAAWEATCARLEREAGVDVVPVAVPSLRHALATYYILAVAEASSNLSRYDGLRYGHSARAQEDAYEAASLSLHDVYTRNRTEGFGAEVRRRVLAGTFVLSSGAYSAFVDKAQRLRRVIAEEVLGALRGVDALLTPTAATPAPTFEEVRALDGSPEAYLTDALTVPANLVGAPAVSVPCRSDAELGMQLMAAPLADRALLRWAADVL